MKYVAIPNTDLRVSQICMGSTNVGESITVPDSFALLDEFVALGGTFIDTAHIYSDWIPGTKSTSEKIIGQWLQSRGLRSQLVIGTKGAHPNIPTMHVSRLSHAEIVQDLTESLDFLQIDVIDLYWLHRDDVAIPVGEIIDILNEQVAAGKIRYFGASNWTIPRIQAAQDYAVSKGIHGFVANQPMFSLALPDMAKHPDQTIVALDEAGVEFHRRTGMAVLAYSSQAHGFFSKLDQGNRASIADVDWRIYDSPTNHQRLGRIQEVARQHGADVNDIVLAYLLAQPFPTIPIIGSKRLEHLRSSVKALEVMLTPAERAYLENGG